MDPTSLDTLTIRAAGARRANGSIALVTLITPNTLTSYTSCITSRSVWLGELPRAMPALLTRMSSRPYSRSIHSAASRTDASRVTSSETNRASTPSARSSRSASSPRSWSRAPASTVKPRAPNCRAVSSPIPLLAPVIRAIVVVIAPTLRGARSTGETGRAWDQRYHPRRGRRRSQGETLRGMNSTNRAELAAFLRARRARLNPRQVGLPATGAPGRRRTPGLRRQEVAQLAGMSVDYYIRLEQGRGPHPSRQVLSALARALMLTADERDYLFRVAGESPPQVAGPSHEIAPGLRHLLDGMPGTPAYVVDAAYNVLAWNQLATHFIGDLSAYEDRNMIRWTFRWAQDTFWTDEDFVRFTRSMIADLRVAYARYPGDPGIDSLVTEMLALSPRFAELWSAHEVEARGPMRKR